MGIQINGNTDIISANDGGLTVQGAELSGNNINVTGIITATSFSGNLTGNSTGNLTGNVNATGISTFSGGIQVGATTSIVVGSSFIKNNSVGLGQTDTTGRNAGVSTAIGSIIYNSTTGLVEVYNGSSWQSTSDRYLQASGGTVSTYYSGGVLFATHTFT